LNGDGIPDIVVGTAFSLAVFLGNANGSLQAAASYTIPNQFNFKVRIGDFNGDGKADVAAAANGVNIFLGNGDGSLQAPMNYDSGFFCNGVAAGDFNGD